MQFDEQRIDDAVLALLVAFCFDDGRSWKGFDRDVMNRLHERGYISNPVGKAKSVSLTEEGEARGRALARALFA